jgi:branched-chain amino acid transport system permease protein
VNVTLPSAAGWVELLLGGMTLGGIYALMAFALSLVLATTHVLNIAHGVLLVIGAAVASLLQLTGMSLPVQVILLLVVAVFIGLGFESAFVRPFIAKPLEVILVSSILITFGLAQALEAFLGFYWAKYVNPQPTFSLPFSLPRLEFGELNLSGTRLAILALTVVIAFAVHLFLTRTALGVASRAAAQDHDAALIIGVNPRRVSMAIFSLSTVLTVIAGVLYASLTPLAPYDGLRLTVVAFTIVVIGGVGSLPGALFGGILVGIAEVLTGFFVGQQWAPTMYLAVFFAILLIRPQGLLTAGRA